jgi:Kef-type K+ transport system membrane component KefB
MHEYLSDINIRPLFSFFTAILTGLFIDAPLQSCQLPNVTGYIIAGYHGPYVLINSV